MHGKPYDLCTAYADEAPSIQADTSSCFLYFFAAKKQPQSSFPAPGPSGAMAVQCLSSLPSQMMTWPEVRWLCAPRRAGSAARGHRMAMVSGWRT